MHVLIVYAHPEPRSFNAAMKDTAVRALRAAGHTVTISDLYAMNFNPVVSRADFTTTHDPDHFDVLAEQRHTASLGAPYAPDVQEEQRKVTAADVVIFQFPVWWRGMPAILKGWVDRVLTLDFAYGGGKYYETGGLKGRRAMLTATTSMPMTDAQVHEWLYQTQDGVLALTGFQVLAPFVVAPKAATAEEREAILEQYAHRMHALAVTPATELAPPSRAAARRG